jgi:low affinity Fe/Cu permease
MWLMTLFINRTERRDTPALHAKLDELLPTHGEASIDLTTLDDLDVEDIEEQRKRHRLLGAQVNRGTPKGANIAVPSVRR